MSELFPPSVVEIIVELERELLARRRVYANRKMTGRLTKDTAERRIQIIEALVDRLYGEATQLDLQGLADHKEKRKQRQQQRQQQRAARQKRAEENANPQR
jgi:hypothetical protein